MKNLILLFQVVIISLAVNVVASAPTWGAKTDNTNKELSEQAVGTGKSSELDFNSASGQETKIENKKERSSSLIWPVVLAGLMFCSVGAAYFKGRKANIISKTFNLFELPFPAKLTVSFVLLSFALTHAFALITVYLDTRVVYSSAQEYYFYLKPARLTALSHAHLMAIATMDGLVAILFSISHCRRNYSFASAVVTMTFVGIITDIAAWWMTKYWGSSFEILSVFSGIFFSLGFSMMSLHVFYKMWFRQNILGALHP